MNDASRDRLLWLISLCSTPLELQRCKDDIGDHYIAEPEINTALVQRESDISKRRATNMKRR